MAHYECITNLEAVNALNWAVSEGAGGLFSSPLVEESLRPYVSKLVPILQIGAAVSFP